MATRVTTSHWPCQEQGQRSEWSKALSLFYGNADNTAAIADVHVVQQVLAACAKVGNLNLARLMVDEWFLVGRDGFFLVKDVPMMDLWSSWRQFFCKGLQMVALDIS